jgi:4-amino-4-deoxy-L-arabinose transferase-like glycosyltransferase
LELHLHFMSDKAFNRFFYISLAVLACIYAIGMQLDLMDVDSTTYALLSKQMFQSGSYLQLYLNGIDYLDKPPLVFWVTCLSYKIFGIHDWAYRLPSVLCLALGLYSIYRYAILFYSKRAAKMAVLIMASCMATYVMTSDVRTDTMLTGWVMFSMWQLAEFNRSLKLKNILLGGVGVGCAMMTKGPIGLIIPVTAFAVEFAYKRQWKSFFRWQYLLAVLVIAILLIPMSYGLYQQFDLHPEKVIYDRTGTSGLRFFYWTQSFGRITGESSWNNNPDPFFLYHSFLWSFAPWCVLFIPALYTEIKNKIKNLKKPDGSEAMTVAGFVLILIFLSRSKYQLPHYTFAIHPLAAILTAKYIDERFTSNIKSKLFSAFYGIHIFLMFIIFAILDLIVFYIFPAPKFFILLISLSLGAFLYALFLWKVNTSQKIFVFTLIPFVTLTLIFNTYFYPKVLTYQTGSYLSQQLNKSAPAGSKLIVYRDFNSYSMQYYSNLQLGQYVDDKSLKPMLVRGKTYIFTDTSYVKEIKNVNPEITIEGTYYSHSPTLLSWGFLNPATRNANVDHWVLMKY